ncbi:MAG: alpha/beta fold hydrolase, partial [Pseudomonadota bacterium]
MRTSTTEWRSMGRVATVSGHRLHYVDSGGDSGRKLLLIHGFPTAGWDFAAIYPTLCETCRVIVPDMLGFGFSDKPRGHDYRIVEQAALLDELLATLGVGEVGILAHDYGDSVAQELLARQLDGQLKTRLSSVCLLNGGLFPETHRPRLIQRLLLTPLGALLGRAVSQRSFDRSMRGVFGAATQPSRAELDAFWQLVNHGDGRRIVHRLIRY